MTYGTRIKVIRPGSNMDGLLGKIISINDPFGKDQYRIELDCGLRVWLNKACLTAA